MASRSICFQSIASPADGSSIRPRREITPCTLVTSDERSLFFVVIFLSLFSFFIGFFYREISWKARILGTNWSKRGRVNEESFEIKRGKLDNKLCHDKMEQSRHLVIIFLSLSQVDECESRRFLDDSPEEKEDRLRDR